MEVSSLSHRVARFVIQLVMMLLVSPAALAVTGDGQINESTVRTPKASPRAARVRIPLKLTPYSKVVVKSPDGVNRIEYRPTGTMRHMLRARIERPNHFYIGEWHVETVPQSWSRETMRYDVKMRFFKRYGEGRELEEYIGHVDLTGSLRGEEYLYVLHGEAKSEFNNPHGQRILDIVAGFVPPKEEAPLIGRADTPTGEPDVAVKGRPEAPVVR